MDNSVFTDFCFKTTNAQPHTSCIAIVAIASMAILDLVCVEVVVVVVVVLESRD